MKMAGQSERQIGEYLGVSRSVINQDYKIVLGKLADEYRPDADRLRGSPDGPLRGARRYVLPQDGRRGPQNRGSGLLPEPLLASEGWSRQL